MYLILGANNNDAMKVQYHVSEWDTMTDCVRAWKGRNPRGRVMVIDTVTGDTMRFGRWDKSRLGVSENAGV